MERGRHPGPDRALQSRRPDALQHDDRRLPNAIYARPGRDEEIEKVRQSIRAAGQAGLPVVEYNFYAHRAMEGYYEETGRAGAGYTAVRLRPQ